jgi:DNA polymerase-3 subunit epsilon
MLDFVANHYAHVLLEEHIAFVREFRALPRNAQCLYVRLVNRKGRIFARNKIRYPELGDLQPLLDTLVAGGWVGQPQESDFDGLLGFLTRSELYQILLPRFAGMGRGLKKAELVEFAREHAQPRDLTASLESGRVLVQQRSDEVRYLLFLYFGRIRDSLSQFTMRDLGLVRTQDFKDTYEARFTDREEAIEHYFFASRLKDVQRAPEADIARMSEEVQRWPVANYAASSRLRDELALKLGRRMEKVGNDTLALGIYRAGESTECNERLVRLLLRSGERDQAREHLERCLDEPRSDEEWLVARDLYERKFQQKRTSTLTDTIVAADIVDIDESKSGSPERAVIEHFESEGRQAYRTENLLWRTLFGLLFWNELFVGDDSALHSPFEFVPASLGNESFYPSRQEQIEARLALLRDRVAVKRFLLKISTERYGTPNGVFRWRRELNEAVYALLDHADADSVALILRQMCKSYEDSRYGYPDLMVIDDEGVLFVEVKTQGDQLRRNQLVRLEQLRGAGFRADVLRVRWILDPQQHYVVVDVETTGGRGDRHRVTEIGAVKVRDGEVIDRFQTLLNPQRTIPPGITRLTGISPAMVEDAPYFADVADAFEKFMEGAIFVAHNVEFDYGFIASEFARIGRTFRHPKLCTCASMRKLYPGKRSYSLASLCRSFEIPLKQHHRALCDAEAAAELLLLINEKRLAEQRSARCSPC